MRSSWSFVALTMFGCAGQDKVSSSPPLDIVARCAEVLHLADNLFPTDRYSFVAEHCVVPMLREPTCRDAVVRSLEVDASTRSRMVAQACTRAYCGRIRADKPELCTRDFEALTASELRPLGMELFARVRVLELGVAEARRWDELVGAPVTVAAVPPPAEAPTTKVAEAPPKKVAEAPPKKVAEAPPKKVEPPKKVAEVPPKKVAEAPPKKVAEAPPKKVEPPKVVEPPKKVAEVPAPKKVVEPPAKTTSQTPAPKGNSTAVSASGELRLRLALRNRMLDIAVGSESWNLPAKPSPSDFDAPAGRVAQLAAKAQQVVIEVGDGIEYHHLVGILNALGARQIRNIAIASDED